MTDDEELFHHEVTPWTVGQLREALRGLPDETPLEVAYAEEPGGDSVSTQVLIGADFGVGRWGSGEEFISREFQLLCEFPTGDYYRRIRR